MRVLFESPRVPMRFVDPRSGNVYEGHGFLTVYLYGPDDEPPKLPGTDKPILRPRPIAEVRAQYGAGNPVVVVPKEQFRDFLGPVTIPESLLNGLPEDARIEWRWGFQ